MSVDEIKIRFLVVIDWLSSCSKNSYPLYTKFEPNNSPAFFCKTTIACILCRYTAFALLALFANFLSTNIITNTQCSEKITVLLIQPNPTHHMCWKMRLNPTHGWTQTMSISGLASALWIDRRDLLAKICVVNFVFLFVISFKTQVAADLIGLSHIFRRETLCLLLNGWKDIIFDALFDCT